MPKIYVTDFSEEACLEYVKQLNSIVQAFGPEQPIVVQIESPGGSVAGLTIIYDALKSTENPIITYTSGTAMSAGAFLFSTAAKPGNRIIGENAMVMIHEVQSGAFGDIKEIREELKFTERLNETWMGLLSKSMGLNNSANLKKLMKSKTESNEWYLDAKEAIEHNVADHIGSVKLQPSIGFNVLIVPPAVDVSSEEEVLEILEEPTKKKYKKRKKKK